MERDNKMILLFLCILFLSISANLYATYDKSEANKSTGFSGNSIFQNYGDENINIMNGNLTLVHPNSPSYPVNGSFSYQLKRIYNSKIWAFDEDVCNPDSPPDIIHPPLPVFVSPSSIGAGWTFHLGRIYFTKSYDNANMNTAQYYFQSSDGAIHRLWAVDNQYINYVTRDTSYIKAVLTKTDPQHLQDPSTYTWILYLSDGTKYSFNKYVPPTYPNLDEYKDSIDDNYKGWYPIRIEDIWANGINISYKTSHDDANGIDLRHIIDQITDDHFSENPQRKIVVTELTESDGNVIKPAGWKVPRGVVNQIQVPAFNGQTDTYQFSYEIRRISNPFPYPYNNLQCCGKTCPCTKSPDITQIDPDWAKAGDTISIKIEGTGFCPDSQVTAPGTGNPLNVQSFTYINSTEIHAQIKVNNNAQCYSYNIRVTNPGIAHDDYPFRILCGPAQCIRECNHSCPENEQQSFDILGNQTVESISHYYGDSNHNILDVYISNVVQDGDPQEYNTYLHLIKGANTEVFSIRLIPYLIGKHLIFYFSDTCSTNIYAQPIGNYRIRITGNQYTDVALQTFPCYYNNSQHPYQWPDCENKPQACKGQFPPYDAYFGGCIWIYSFPDYSCYHPDWDPNDPNDPQLQLHDCAPQFTLSDGPDGQKLSDDYLHLTHLCTEHNNDVFHQIYIKKLSEGPDISKLKIQVYHCPADVCVDPEDADDNDNYDPGDIILGNEIGDGFEIRMRTSEDLGYYKFKIIDDSNDYDPQNPELVSKKNNFLHAGFYLCKHNDNPNPGCPCHDPACKGENCNLNFGFPAIDTKASDIKSTGASMTSSEKSSITAADNDLPNNFNPNQPAFLSPSDDTSSALVRFKDDPYPTDENSPDYLEMSTTGKWPPGDRYAILLTRVVLPTGIEIDYDYNEYGELNKVIYPTGGEVDYAYDYYGYTSCMKLIKAGHDARTEVDDEMTRQVTSKTIKVDADHHYLWQYNRPPSQDYPDQSNPQIVRIIDPDDNITEHEFWTANVTPDSPSSEEDPLRVCSEDRGDVKIINYKNSTNQIFKTETFTYTADNVHDNGNRIFTNVRLQDKITSYPENGKSLTTQYDEWDGYGHWKKECTCDNENPKNCKINYKDYYLHDANRWIINTFHSASIYKRNDCVITNIQPDSRINHLYYSDSSKDGLLYAERRFANPPDQSNDDVRIIYGYDNNANLNSEEWYKGNTMRYRLSYEDSYGIPYKQNYNDLNPPWNIFERGIDPNTSLVSWEEDSAGTRTHYSYDTLNRLTSITPDGELSTDINYVNPNFTKVKRSYDGDSHFYTISQYSYDGMGRLFQQDKIKSDGNFSTQKTSYDSLGRVSFKSEWQHAGPYLGTSYLYDIFGKPTSITTADGKVTSYSYTGISHTEVTSKIKTGGLGETSSTTKYDYDLFGNLTKVIDGSGFVTQYSYNNLDQLTTVNQGGETGQTRNFVYNALGNLLCSQNPENGIVFFGASNDNQCPSTNIFDDWYDARGNVTDKKDAREKTFHFEYDNAERLISLTDTTTSSKVLKENTYDQTNERGASLGKLTNVKSYISGMSDAASEKNYFYEGASDGGRLNSIESVYRTNLNDSTVYTFQSKVDFAYNILGLLDKTTYYEPGLTGSASNPRRKIQNTYQHGFLTKINACSPSSLSCDPNAEGSFPVLTDATYNDAGGLLIYANGAGIDTTITPDGRNRVSFIVSKRNGTEVFNTGIYQYDGSGNIYQIGDDSDPNKDIFRYDLVNRLTSATVHPPSGSSNPDPISQTFEYDNYGNMKIVNENNNIIFNESYTDNKFDNSAYQYDNNGNLTRGKNNNYFDYYDYDVQNQLTDYIYPYHDPNTATNIGKYFYDGNGTRVIKKNHIINSDNEIIDNTILYVHDQAGNVIQEYYVDKDHPDDSTKIRIKDYIYFNGNLLSSIFSDQDAAAVALQSDPYITKSSIIDIPFKWEAHENDSTLVSYKYGLHKCMTENCGILTEDCDPNSGGVDYNNPIPISPRYDQALKDEYISKQLVDAEQYRIAFKLINEANLETFVCSNVITVDLNPPVINSIDDPGDCWPHLDNVVFDWSGEDSVGIKEAYYAIGPDPQHPTDTRDWTLIDPISFHVIAENLDLAPYTPYYVSIKLVDHVGHEVTQASSHGFRTAIERNAISNYDNIKTIINSSQTIHITFINDCAVENWEPGSTYLSVKALNLDDEFYVQLEETIEPGQQYDFEFTLPAEWTSVPRLLKLDIQMTENGEPFGQKVHRETLVSPYMKIASWKILSLNGFADKVYLSAFYKSTRSDTDIGVVAQKCYPGEGCTNGSLHIVPHDKAFFELFECDFNCEDHGVLFILYAPSEKTALSDKDIVASLAGTNANDLTVNTCDARFVDQSERFSNRLIAPYFNTGNNQNNYLMLVNNSSASIPFTMVLRDSTNQNPCNIPQDTIGGNAAKQLILNNLISSHCASSFGTKGSVTIDYTGEAGVLAGVNHIKGSMNYDVDLKDPGTFGSSSVLVIPYFQAIPNTADTKIWLQNTTNQAVSLNINIYPMVLVAPPLNSYPIQLLANEWKEISVSNLSNTLAEGSIEIEQSSHAVVGHSAIEHYTDGYAEDIGLKDPKMQFTMQLHSPFWIQLHNSTTNLKTRLYIHNKADSERKYHVIKEYENTSSYEGDVIVPPPYSYGHNTEIIEPANTTNPRLKEAGLEIQQDSGDLGDLIVSETVINTNTNKSFQVPLSTSYCGLPSMLEGEIIVTCTPPRPHFPPSCQLTGVRLTHHEYVGDITGYKLYYGETAGQWLQVINYTTLPSPSFDLPMPCPSTGKAYYALQPVALCGYIPISNVVEFAVQGCMPENPFGNLDIKHNDERAGGNGNIIPIVDLDSAIIGSFQHGSGTISWGSACTNSTVSNIKIMRQTEEQDAELIYEDTAVDGTIDEEMPQGQYQYWLESLCADGTYRVTPAIQPNPGRNIGPVIIDQQQYDLLLESLGVDPNTIAALKSFSSLPHQNIKKTIHNKVHNMQSGPSANPLNDDSWFDLSYNEPMTSDSVENNNDPDSFTPGNEIYTTSSNASSFRSNKGVKSLTSQSSASSAPSYRLGNSKNSLTFTLTTGEFVRYYVWDHLGSTRLSIRKYDAAIIEESKYLPFGKQMNQSASPDENHKFAGYFRDLESNIDYLGFRHYNNSFYRFLQADKISGDPINSQSWNLYLYTKNNPINSIDILGLENPKSYMSCGETHSLDCKSTSTESSDITYQQWKLANARTADADSLVPNVNASESNDLTNILGINIEIAIWPITGILGFSIGLAQTAGCFDPQCLGWFISYAPPPKIVGDGFTVNLIGGYMKGDIKNLQGKANDWTASADAFSFTEFWSHETGKYNGLDFGIGYGWQWTMATYDTRVKTWQDYKDEKQLKKIYELYLKKKAKDKK